MARGNFLAIGECMIELARDPAGLWRMGFAGDTLNTAWYFRALAPREQWDVDFFTRVGTDRYSDRMVAFLQDAGLGTSRIGRDAARQPGLYLIDVDDGERSFTYWRGQSAARLLADDEAALAAALAAADMVYFSGITLAILAAERRSLLVERIAAARAAGKRTVFDPNIRPRLWEDAGALREAISAAAGAAAIVLPSADDEQAAFGDADPQATARRYLAAGCDEVVVKSGGGPVTLATPDAISVVDGLERVQPVDTTGAGDSFNGAYLARRAAGDGRTEAVRQAHAVASRVVRRPGALIDMADLRCQPLRPDRRRRP
ncbi:MAG: 2-dehydro-3-deoxygluconokinase [Alphaproteobacteria bacterium]|nr:MAG: 2-dehydro-3-deoxygluconokinase [Alphaproteobacteria bacterium]